MKGNTPETRSNLLPKMLRVTSCNQNTPQQEPDHTVIFHCALVTNTITQTPLHITVTIITITTVSITSTIIIIFTIDISIILMTPEFSSGSPPRREASVSCVESEGVIGKRVKNINFHVSEFQSRQPRPLQITDPQSKGRNPHCNGVDPRPPGRRRRRRQEEDGGMGGMRRRMQEAGQQHKEGTTHHREEDDKEDAG